MVYQYKEKKFKGGKGMRRIICMFGVVSVVTVLLLVGVAGAQQFPILDRVAEKVVQKYQTATCEQLWEQKGKPKSPEEERVVNLLRNDPQMRQEFINRVAAPIANKMFECGMIP
jgi:hypothetical protein